MHYYQFNIGDYSSHTSRLSIYEDLAYRRLLDLYYLSERPLNGCSTDVAREIGMLDTLSDVEFVLNKFFTEKNNAWHNKRCDREIKAYKAKQKGAKKAGIASGIARKNKRTTVERPLNGKGTTVEPNINHKPLTINQETKIKITASRFDDFWKAYPEKKGKKKTLEIWKRRKLDLKADILINDVTSRIVSDKNWIDGYIPNPTTYLNGDRWEDEIKGDIKTESVDPYTHYRKLGSEKGIHPIGSESNKDYIGRVKECLA